MSVYYTVETSDGCGFKMLYDPSLPQTPIRIFVGPDHDDRIWSATPYQAVDARDAQHAAELVQEWLDDGAAVETVVRDGEKV